ncbi:hypothetical protein MHM98_13725 [Psychrobium sp. MM17-31]|uniref:hypothetical protein n=1 Tax=Psychrobium sp. MM17-31 TaxID=2917758 RepID=UPI001EF5F16D|nr:hypothetical protein [Psychrobium sp. MM17-31]MCG7532392.1 hypothetical protein [Psychrobium sp. MM17-31]
MDFMETVDAVFSLIFGFAFIVFGLGGVVTERHQKHKRERESQTPLMSYANLESRGEITESEKEALEELYRIEVADDSMFFVQGDYEYDSVEFRTSHGLPTLEIVDVTVVIPHAVNPILMNNQAVAITGVVYENRLYPLAIADQWKLFDFSDSAIEHVAKKKRKAGSTQQQGEREITQAEWQVLFNHNFSCSLTSWVLFALCIYVGIFFWGADGITTSWQFIVPVVGSLAFNLVYIWLAKRHFKGRERPKIINARGTVLDLKIHVGEHDKIDLVIGKQTFVMPVNWVTPTLQYSRVNFSYAELARREPYLLSLGRHKLVDDAFGQRPKKSYLTSHFVYLSMLLIMVFMNLDWTQNLRALRPVLGMTDHYQLSTPQQFSSTNFKAGDTLIYSGKLRCLIGDIIDLTPVCNHVVLDEPSNEKVDEIALDKWSIEAIDAFKSSVFYPPTKGYKYTMLAVNHINSTRSMYARSTTDMLVFDRSRLQELAKTIDKYCDGSVSCFDLKEHLSINYHALVKKQNAHQSKEISAQVKERYWQAMRNGEHNVNWIFRTSSTYTLLVNAHRRYLEQMALDELNQFDDDAVMLTLVQSKNKDSFNKINRRFRELIHNLSAPNYQTLQLDMGNYSQQNIGQLTFDYLDKHNQSPVFIQGKTSSWFTAINVSVFSLILIVVGYLILFNRCTAYWQLRSLFSDDIYAERENNAEAQRIIAQEIARVKREAERHSD